jgi:UDP-glucose 4-epimerase
VREVIEAARRVTGREIVALEEARRPGDPPRLVASNARARSGLGWTPERSLEEMVGDAWVWHQAHPGGYGAAG